MKKVISLLIAIVMLMACVPAAFAVTGGFSGGSVNANPGETVTVSFSIWGEDVCGAEGNLTWDEGLTVVGEGAKGGAWAYGDAGSNSFFVANEDPATGTAATFTFQVADNASGTLNVYCNGEVVGLVDDATGASATFSIVLPEATEPTKPEETTVETEEPTKPEETTEPEETTVETEPTETKPEPSTEPEGSDDEPKTGDITPHIVMSVAAVIAVAAGAMFVFKRKAA